MKKLLIAVFLVLFSTACFGIGVPSPSTPRPEVDSSGNLLSDTYPAPVKALALTGEVATAADVLFTEIATATSRLEATASGTTSAVNVLNASVSAGIASTIIQLNINTASNTQSLTQVENAASGTTSAVDVFNASLTTLIDNHTASASGNATTTWATMLYLTDNSAIQRWFTALVLGDDVNGNNTAAVAPWIWDGTYWDRLPGNGSDGVFVYADDINAGIASTIIQIDILNASLSAAIASTTGDVQLVKAAVTSNTVQIDILNASLTQSLTQVENAASGTTSAVNIANASVSAGIASAIIQIDILNASASAAIATTNADVNILNASLTQSLTQVENAASGTTSEVSIANASLSAGIASTTVQLDIANASVSAAVASVVAELESLDVLASTSHYEMTETSTDITALTGRNWISFQNKGVESIFVNAGNTPAATDDWEVYPQGTISFEHVDAMATFSAVCDTGKTASATVAQGAK